MYKQPDLISRLQDEADLCRNDGADDISALLDEAVSALRDRNHDTAVGEKWRTDSRLEELFPLTAERLAALEAENAALKREAHTWWTAARDAAKEQTEAWILVAWVEKDGELVWHDRELAAGRNLYAKGPNGKVSR